MKENNSKFGASVRIFSRIVCDFGRVFLACALIMISSIAIFVSFSLYPKINSFLAASRATPWGVITSIFVHSSLTDLAFNMIGLFVYTLLFAVCNISLTSENKRKIEPFFLICVFGSAIVANIFWICLTSGRSLGASGIVYAVQGVLLGFSIINGLSILDWKRFKIQKKFTQFIVLINIIVIIWFLSEILLSPQMFLNVAVRVNSLVHGISFCLSLVITVVWNSYIKKISVFV
jgi:membrane associated rhomboid family serine protease